MADTTVIGLTTAKINGTYRVDVKNARWSVKRNNTQTVTAGGVVIARGQEIPSGSFDEVIPRDKIFDWRSLQSFSVEILDQETRSITIASFTGCEWGGIDGNADLGQAAAGRAISWNGTTVVKA